MRRGKEILPDEIFLDSQNLPDFDVQQFEGRLEKPISKFAIGTLGLFFGLAGTVLVARAFQLTVQEGPALEAKSVQNTLHHTPSFAERSVILDRNGVPLAWNNPDRTYIQSAGFSHLIGYLGAASASEGSVGEDGVEKSFDAKLRGTDGVKIVESDAHGNIKQESVYQPPIPSPPLTLSIDSRVQSALYAHIKQLAEERGFVGGSGILMNVQDGSLLALTSYPEYDPESIASSLADPRKPFLNRAIGGLYAPGSVVKPIIALGALNEHIIDPNKTILSTGSISIPNPYDPTKKSVFLDWRPQGWVDMRHALEVSSDVYFYEVGGGYQDQPGLGIARIEQYFRLFGYGTTTGIELDGEQTGVIPSPAWKAAQFKGDPWRIGDTYHTAIGQYGLTITPIEEVRAVAAIANGGTLLTPTILLSGRTPASVSIPIPQEYFTVVHEGMRLSAQAGTAAALNTPDVEIAAKTGTAEIGTVKKYVNSVVIGFFPYQHPRYAFVMVMERGPRTNLVGAPVAMRGVIDWMAQHTPEYLK